MKRTNKTTSILTKIAGIFILAFLFSCSEDGQEAEAILPEKKTEEPETPEPEEGSETGYYELSNLPEDKGGTHLGCHLGNSPSPYGYYIYKPSCYNDREDIVFPVLIYLHGSSEKGNSKDNIKVLEKVLKHGPPKLIENKEWHTKYPMLVFSPQDHKGGWTPQLLKEYIDFIVANYKVNVKRIYITGNSMGGYGIYGYLGAYGENSLIAASVPICGKGDPSKAENYKKIPLWAFHGEADNAIHYSSSLAMVNAINEVEPEHEAKITLYPGVDHYESWTITYDETGMGRENPDYDPFDQSIIDWMLQHQRCDLDSLITEK